MRALHTYGNHFRTRWVTVHSTQQDGFEAFDANALAKQAKATPFKRPENGVFAPASGFSRFVFTETGDTDADSQAGAALGGFGARFELSEAGPRAMQGHLRMVIRGDELHTGFDNISFADRTTVFVAEDAGDTLHTQRGRFDSLYAPDADPIVRAAWWANPFQGIRSGPFEGCKSVRAEPIENQSERLMSITHQ